MPPAARTRFAGRARASLEDGLITARGVVKIIRVAWTIADLAGRPRPAKDDCQTALSLWLGVQR